MIFDKTDIDGLFVGHLARIEDSRGFFVRSFCIDESQKVMDKNIVQINHSLTKDSGSIRGMHYQIPPFCEIKVVRCIRGSVFDVAIDLRKDSQTFLKWHGEVLSDVNMKMMVIPEGFAHGFQTLEESCEMLYLHTASYSKEHELGVRYDDPLIGINWKLPVSNISEKDQIRPLLDKLFKGVET